MTDQPTSVPLFEAVAPQLVDVAMGRTHADLVVRNARWGNVHSGEILPQTDPHIVMISGFNSGDVMDKPGGEYIDQFLTKPVSPSHLFDAVMAAFGKKMTLIGESGAGQLAKSVNQICIAGIVQGLAEGLHFAEKAGLDAAKVIEAISGGAAQSRRLGLRMS